MFTCVCLSEVCASVKVHTLSLWFGLMQEVWLDQEDVQLLKEAEEVTLMDWGNAFVQTITKSLDGKTITGTAQAATMLLSCNPQASTLKMQDWYVLSEGQCTFDVYFFFLRVTQSFFIAFYHVYGNCYWKHGKQSCDNRLPEGPVEILLNLDFTTINICNRHSPSIEMTVPVYSVVFRK